MEHFLFGIQASAFYGSPLRNSGISLLWKPPPEFRRQSFMEVSPEFRRQPFMEVSPEFRRQPFMKPFKKIIGVNYYPNRAVPGSRFTVQRLKILSKLNLIPLDQNWVFSLLGE